MTTPVALTRGGPGTPIFAVHNGAGSAYPYVPIARALGPHQPFYAFQQYELNKASKPLSSVDEMAEEYLDAVRRVRPIGPYAFAGMCSTGAYVAYEMGQRARALGERVELVILFDPMKSEAVQLCLEGRMIIVQALDVIGRMTELPDFHPRTPALRAELANLVAALGLEPAMLELAPSQLAQFLELFASNHDASLHYSPQPYPGRAIIFFPAVSDDSHRLFSDVQWKTLVPTAEVYSIPIDSTGLYSDPATITYIAAAVSAALRLLGTCRRSIPTSRFTGVTEDEASPASRIR